MAARLIGRAGAWNAAADEAMTTSAAARIARAEAMRILDFDILAELELFILYFMFTGWLILLRFYAV